LIWVRKRWYCSWLTGKSGGTAECIFTGSNDYRCFVKYSEWHYCNKDENTCNCSNLSYHTNFSRRDSGLTVLNIPLDMQTIVHGVVLIISLVVYEMVKRRTRSRKMKAVKEKLANE